MVVPPILTLVQVRPSRRPSRAHRKALSPPRNLKPASVRQRHEARPHLPLPRQPKLLLKRHRLHSRRAASACIPSAVLAREAGLFVMQSVVVVRGRCERTLPQRLLAAARHPLVLLLIRRSATCRGRGRVVVYGPSFENGSVSGGRGGSGYAVLSTNGGT
ncbi:hypothetical protein B0H12DRAFT_1111040 [Mycena haematopus]|nr:hypothetical protein B0H12DRAFT_1111040 [Mycena haematopus]